MTVWPTRIFTGQDSAVINAAQQRLQELEQAARRLLPALGSPGIDK